MWSVERATFASTGAPSGEPFGAGGRATGEERQRAPAGGGHPAGLAARFLSDRLQVGLFSHRGGFLRRGRRAPIPRNPIRASGQEHTGQATSRWMAPYAIFVKIFLKLQFLRKAVY